MTTSWQISVWNVYSVQGYHSLGRKIPRFFPDEIAGSMSNQCTFINQILCEHHVWKINYSMNKIQVSVDDRRMCPCTSQFMQFTPKFGYQHSVELPQSNFPDYTNSLTFSWLFPDLKPFPGLFTDLSRTPWHFQVSRYSRQVVTLSLLYETDDDTHWLIHNTQLSSNQLSFTGSQIWLSRNWQINWKLNE